MTALRVIWGTMGLQMKNSFVRPMFRFCLLVGPVANTILLYYMFQTSGMEHFMTYVIVGAGLASVWECVCFSSIGDIDRERWHGTLPLLFAAPAGFHLIILGKIIGNTVLSLVSLVLSAATAYLLFGARLVIPSVLSLAAALTVSLAAFVVVSQLFAYLLTLSRKTWLYMNCLSIPIALICGFVVPVEALPGWIRPASYLLPPTWAVTLIRGAFGNEPERGARLLQYGILGAELLIYAVLCQIFYKIIERRVKIAAGLELM